MAIFESSLKQTEIIIKRLKCAEQGKKNPWIELKTIWNGQRWSDPQNLTFDEKCGDSKFIIKAK